MTRSIGVEIVKGLINNLPGDVNVSGEACVAVKLTEDGVAEVQSRSTVGVPDSVGLGASAATLAAVTNKEREIRLDTVDGDDDTLSTVISQVAGNLSVVHGNEVVAVDLIQRETSEKVALNEAEVLIGKAGAASFHLLDIIVVGSKSGAAVKHGLGKGRCGKEADGSKNLAHHLDFGVSL